MIQKAYKFKIYPNNVQKILLNKTFGCVRYAWNQWVTEFNKKTNTYKNTTELRKELDWMREVSAGAIQQKERDFTEFKNQFFNKKRKNKINKPKFKSKKNKQSFRLPNQKFSIVNNRLKLEKIGFITCVFDREIPEDVKYINCTISKDRCNDYYVSITVEQDTIQLPKTGKEIGIDVGLKNFCTLSNGEMVENPKYFNENQVKIKKIDQHLKRKKIGSNRYIKCRIQLAKEHRKIQRKRTFFLHNVSTNLVKNYDVICIEDLNVAGMLKNHNLAKSISDVSWSEFFKMLTYKCSWYGKELKKVNRFEPTSKACSVCGYYYKDMNLNIRDWICPSCNTNHDRDVNAAKNILKQSVGVNTELQTQRECKSLGLQTNVIPNEVSIQS